MKNLKIRLTTLKLTIKIIHFKDNKGVLMLKKKEERNKILLGLLTKLWDPFHCEKKTIKKLAPDTELINGIDYESLMKIKIRIIYS